MHTPNALTKDIKKKLIKNFSTTSMSPEPTDDLVPLILQSRCISTIQVKNFENWLNIYD